jgi:hypothetical protein
MVRLFRVDRASREMLCTVWATDGSHAVALAAEHASDVRGLKAVDITDEHLDPDNPYREHTLAAIAEGRVGCAYLRLTSESTGSGWLFERNPAVPRSASDAPLTKLCA